MEDSGPSAVLDHYFRRLEHALGPLPAYRRAGLIGDIRMHVQEALDAEPDPSEAAVREILERVGDPQKIAQEAMGDEFTVPPPLATRRGRIPAWSALPVGLALAAVVVAIIALSSAHSASASGNHSRLIDQVRRAVRTGLPVVHGWLPAADVSGGGGIDTSSCGPQTMSGSESASTLESGATQVASGSIDGTSWSVWSKHGRSGATGIEDGGVVIGGVAHGMCPGFPNPSELELLDPSGGDHGIAYGVIGYPGASKVAIYSSAAGSFETGKLAGSTTSEAVDGVSFFITTLSRSACDYPALELNIASARYASEHNLGFTSADCSAGKLVPIDDSQGVWQLPTKDFPDHYGSGFGGGGLAAPTLTKAGWLPGADVSGGGGADTSSCRPQTLSGAEPASRLEANGTEVASGHTDGHSWSVWSRRGDRGANGIENGGVVIDGVAHGMCPGFPNPAEMELLDPAGGGDGIAYGVIGYPGASTVKIYSSTVETFDADRLLATTKSHVVSGVGFFITALSSSACRYRALELNATATRYSSQHNLGFNTPRCSAGQLVPIDDSQGAWGG